MVQQGGHLFTVDHKTSSIFGEGFFREQSVNPQHEGYCWAVEKTLGTLPKGFIINAIRTRPPTKGASRPDVSAEDFLRQKTFVDAERIAEWETNTMAIITEFFWKYVRGYYPTERKWCANKYGTCQYFDVCGVPRNNRHMMLYSGMYTTNTWSPLTDAQKILERKRVELMREVIVTGAFDHVSQPILPPKEMTPDDFLNTSL